MPSTLRLVAAACLLPVIALAADHPAVKLGLWEISHQSDAGGAPAGTPAGAPAIPPDVLARLPPEARARMEAAMAARGGQGAGGGAHSTKQCVTQESLDHAFEREDDRDHKCTHTIVSKTATSMEMHLACANVGGTGASTEGSFKWALSTPESMQGSMDLVTNVAGHTITHHSDVSGKWLGADCGDVKPHLPPAK